MNDFIVSIDFYPMVFGKNKTFRVVTELSKEEVDEIISKKARKENPYFDSIFVCVETVEEYLSDIKIEEI